MFTGIIEETGILSEKKQGAVSAQVKIRCQKVLEGTKVGDSIAVNGICLTVTSLAKDGPFWRACSQNPWGTWGTKSSLLLAIALLGRFHISSGAMPMQLMMLLSKCSAAEAFSPV